MKKPRIPHDLLWKTIKKHPDWSLTKVAFYLAEQGHVNGMTGRPFTSAALSLLLRTTPEGKRLVSLRAKYR